MSNSIFSISLSFLFSLFTIFLPNEMEKAPYPSPTTQSTEEGYCPSGYRIFHKFIKVVKNSKYNCYGQPSSPYQEYYCPNHRLGKYGRGTCNGTYTKQEFCQNGKTVNLYHTNTRCTCGCADKNFHGHKLNILDLKGCGCTDEEQIAVDEF